MNRLLLTIGMILVMLPVTAANAATKTVVAVGDIACTASAPVTPTTCHQREVAALAQRLKPDSTWLLGDIQYPQASLEDLSSSFGPAWSMHKRKWRPTPGNHEYYTKQADGYYDFFGAAAGAQNRGWYSFELGDWHVVSLNSNCDVINCAFASMQMRWLRRDLRQNDKQCVAAFWHHPRFSSGDHGANAMVSGLFRELRKARVEFVLTGHDHVYERFAPMTESGAVRRRGVRQFVAGTGGMALRPPRQPINGSRYFSTSTFGVLELKLRRDRYRWRFVTEAGDSRDRGAARCR